MKKYNIKRSKCSLLGQLADKLGDGEPVALSDVVEQPQGVVLHHHRVRVDGLLSLVHPALDDLVAWKQISEALNKTESTT